MSNTSAFGGGGGERAKAVYGGREVVWAPNPGPQTLLLTCPLPDVFFGGARGGGKTWGLLGDWLQHANKWGGRARGIFFRKTYKQMDEVIDRSKRIFSTTGATYYSAEYTWKWPSGASLRFRYLDRDADADEYHGQEFCVEMGTPVVMADGTWKPIECISVGEEVLTLEGPRRVTRTVAPYVAHCVSMEVFDREGRMVGVQRHPEWHPVLGRDGVLDRAPAATPRTSERALPSSAPLSCTPQGSWKRGGPDAPGWISWTGATRTGCTASSGERPEAEPPRELTVPVALHARTVRSVRAAPTHVSLEDGEDTTRTYTQCMGQRTWRHLYSGEERHLSEEVEDGTARISPCGPLLVADITVEDANHYITTTGAVNGQTWQAFDELTNWASPKPIDKLMACLRSADGVFCVRRSTGNPGGPGTKWVRDRYIKDRIPGQPFDLIPNEKLPHLSVRAVFIPSKLEDNPKIYIDDPGYESRLALSTFGDADLWQAWREGNWDVLVGRYFERFDPERNVYDPAKVSLAPWMPKWISVDWGYQHPSAVYWYTWDGTTIWVHREFVRSGLTPEQLAYEIGGMSMGEDIDAIYLSHDAFGRKVSERTIAQEMSDVFRQFNLPDPTQADNDRVGGALLLQQLFGESRLMISKNCQKLIECIPLCQRDTSDGGDPEDVDKFDGDDPYDSLRYGVKTRPRMVRVPDEVLLSKRITASDPHSRHMQMRIAQAELHSQQTLHAVTRRGNGWWRHAEATN